MIAYEGRTETGSASLLGRETSSKHCIFQYGDSHFAILATAVREITHAPPLVRVPRCPSSLAGLCHIRSEFVPVIQLGPLLGEGEFQATQSAQLLLLSSALGAWALMIDRAISIETIETHVDTVAAGDGQRSAVLGTATYEAEIVRVLDPQALLQLVHQSGHRQWDSGHDLESAPPKFSAEAFA